MFSCISESFLCTSNVLTTARTVFENLEAKKDNMKKNLAMNGGMNLTEAVWLSLFMATGRRSWAQSCVKRLVAQARKSGNGFITVLKQDPEIRSYFDEKTIDRILTPEHYIGTAREQIDDVIQAIQAAK